ncbi:MAG: Ig-like domain-containing protein [Deltaproteobacteria bacterium]|nr:Ig-like domain-containing protein [Deltaproteobacteria bacterium]
MKRERGPRWLRWLALLGVICCCTLPSRAAFAQETCDDAGGPPLDFGQLIETFPSHNATRIPRDGFVRFVYRGRVPPRAVMLVRDDMTSATVPGELTIVGAELHFRASEPLQPNRRYVATAPDISSGEASVRFTTGTTLANSDGPTNFDGAVSVTSARIGPTDICGDADAREVTVAWRFARTSPWPQTELTYIVYETRGPNLTGPLERARERGRLSTSPCAMGAEQCVTLRLSSANASGPACFAVHVYDPLGRRADNNAERCVNLDAGNYFNGCSIARRPSVGPSRERAEGGVMAMLLALVAIYPRRPHRRYTRVAS